MRDRLGNFFNPVGGSVTRRMFWAGLLVRLAYITFAHTYRMRLIGDHFEFGYEMGRIARALNTGYGYADPFNGHSGPTAWVPPLYPLLLALIFKVFGIYTLASGWMILALNSLFSAATVWPVVEIARRCFGDRKPRGESIALWSGWLWALYPAAMQYAVKWVWDMPVTAFLFASVLALALRLRGIGSKPPAPALTWIAFGLLWGLIALSNSALLTFLPACGLWILWPSLRAPGQSWPALRNALLAAICCLALLAPWIGRNQRVFHAFVPLRSNLGAELYETVAPENDGYARGTTVSLATNSPDFQRYLRLGELEYCRQQGVLAKAIFRAHRGRSLAQLFKRVYFFWVSVPHPANDHPAGEIARVANFAFLSIAALLGLALALARNVPGAWLFFWAFALTPLVYYVVTVQARFRHPLEPLMTILIVYLFQSARMPSDQLRKATA